MTTTSNSLPIVQPVRKGTKFMSYYSKTESPESYLVVEHRAEGPARKGSWQTPSMRAVWIYRGYRAI